MVLEVTVLGFTVKDGKTKVFPKVCAGVDIENV